MRRQKRREGPAPAEDADSVSEDSDDFEIACRQKKHKHAHEVKECVYVIPDLPAQGPQDATVRLESCELATPLLARLTD